MYTLASRLISSWEINQLLKYLVPTKQREKLPLDNRSCHVLSTNLDELSPIDHKMFAWGETTCCYGIGWWRRILTPCWSLRVWRVMRNLSYRTHKSPEPSSLTLLLQVVMKHKLFCKHNTKWDKCGINLDFGRRTWNKGKHYNTKLMSYLIILRYFKHNLFAIFWYLA